MRYMGLALCMCGVALIACDPADPCDPGFYADHGACLREPESLDAAAGVVDDADSGRTQPMGEPPFDPNDFGKTCSSDDDCGGSAPACGAPMFPLCTALNCLDGSARCPAEWQCLDVTALSPDPSVKSICLNL